MKNILIDITFLTNEFKRKRPAHGIPRVVLAYIRHYLSTMQVVYRVRGRIFIFPQEVSKKIANILLLWDFSSYPQLVRLLVKGVVLAQRVKPGVRYFLFKIDQNGMRYPG